MLIIKNKGEILFDIANTVLMSIIMLLCLYPFYYVLVASLSDPIVVMKSGGIMLFPQGFNISSYKAALAHPSLLISYRNTIFYVVVGTALNILLTSFAAYALSRKNLYGGKVIMLFIIFTMFFSGGMIPSFLVVRYTALYDTIGALILPVAINTFNLIIMRTQLASIPDSVVESAKLDGGNDFIILFRIMLPLALPTVAVITLYYAVGHWNAFFDAMIYLRDRKLFPLQLVLRDMLLNHEGQSSGTGDNVFAISETIKYATIITTTLPILLIYPSLQRYFVKGIMIGSVKE